MTHTLNTQVRITHTRDTVSAQMKAADVLDAVRRSNQGYPLLEELVITDWDAVAGYRQALDEATEQAKITGDWNACAATTQGAHAIPQTRRIDGLLVGPNGQRTAIEVKVTRSDYQRESHEKRRAWQAITHRFVYVVPAGLITAEEVPAGIGLWYATEAGVVSAKPCRINKSPNDPPIQLFNALCYRAMKESEK